MRKPKKTDKSAPVSTTLTPDALESIRGGLNDGLNRDIIRRKV